MFKDEIDGLYKKIESLNNASNEIEPINVKKDGIFVGKDGVVVGKKVESLEDDSNIKLKKDWGDDKPDSGRYY